jgi:hypothetical protein
MIHYGGNGLLQKEGSCDFVIAGPIRFAPFAEESVIQNVADRFRRERFQ